MNVEFMKILKKKHTLTRCPIQIIYDRFFFYPEQRSNFKLSRDQVLYQNEPVVRIEVNPEGQLRAKFIGPASVATAMEKPNFHALIEGCGDTTPWFDYDDRFDLVSLITGRLKIML